MRFNAWLGCAALAAFVGVLTGCGDRRAASPLSPSLVSSGSNADVRQTRGNVAPRTADTDGDGYDDGDQDPPETPPSPTAPPPNPEPTPEGTPGPLQLTINIIGTVGSGAFAPNPLQAAVGNTIVWTNNDLVTHEIVLDDGTPVGSLAPGQSSAPIALATETAGYHCTFHPSMVGQVTTIPAAPPAGDPSAPSDPSAPPADPGTPPPDPYDYGDDY